MVALFNYDRTPSASLLRRWYRREKCRYCNVSALTPKAPRSILAMPRVFFMCTINSSTSPVSTQPVRGRGVLQRGKCVYQGWSINYVTCHIWNSDRPTKMLRTFTLRPAERCYAEAKNPTRAKISSLLICGTSVVFGAPKSPRKH